MNHMLRTVFLSLVLTVTGCATVKSTLKDKLYPEAKADKAALVDLQKKFDGVTSQLTAERQQNDKVTADVKARDSMLLVYVNEAVTGTVKLQPFVQPGEGQRWLSFTGNEAALASDLLTKFGTKPNLDEQNKALLREQATADGKIEQLTANYNDLRAKHDAMVQQYTGDNTKLDQAKKQTDAQLVDAKSEIDALKIELEKNKADNQKNLNSAIDQVKSSIVMDQANKLSSVAIGFALLAGLCLMAAIWLPFKACLTGSGVAGVVAAVLFAWAQFITDTRYKWVIISVPVLVVIITVAFVTKKILSEKASTVTAAKLKVENDNMLSVATVVVRRIKAMYDDGTDMAKIMTDHPEYRTLSDFTEGMVYNQLNMTAQQKADLVKIQWQDKQQRVDGTQVADSKQVTSK